MSLEEKIKATEKNVKEEMETVYTRLANMYINWKASGNEDVYNSYCYLRDMICEQPSVFFDKLEENGQDIADIGVVFDGKVVKIEMLNEDEEMGEQ